MSQPERRLTAILCADVVGYSRLVGRDETGTLARLDEARGILRNAIEGQGGRVFNLAGDGLLAEFPSALAAVQAAITAQDKLGVWAEGQPEDDRMRLRIGVNLGDVVVNGGDLLGDGVNVAARLQALAQPGGICLSGAVYDQVRGRIEIGFADLGPRAMKNIADPVRVYALRIGPDAQRVGSMAPPAEVPQQSSPFDGFRRRLLGYLLILALLLVINLMTSPDYLWVRWPALWFAFMLFWPLLRTLLWGRPENAGGK
ncbi:adenylate/guanylate cyclase domain-containing protein [Inquilinus sp. Marseille-Q2685]|uniref:adenylate/guanylate cyclase domain-containing protein n=1 Tax=Inquilinus sp. Marseille-Q2685 TaxID=2866581 RepID=UPI001CE474F6|nr:adenylate/guanylate cyclase domain-containing protein [Inquilinus sp. Marseille-Q2685]